MKLKQQDKVKVITGKDKGKESVVTKVIPKKNRVIVEGVNQYKRHLKKQSEQNPGGIVEVERPLNVSKVMLICPSCNKPTRVEYKVTKTQKVRICKKCKAEVSTKS